MIETTETVNAWIWIPIAMGAGLLANYAFTKLGEKFKNRKLGIIGLAASGKTTLAEYLANNSLPEETSQTLFAKDYEKRTLADLGMKVCITDSKSNQTKYEYTQEKEILRVSDIILYLFDMSKFFTEEKDKYFKRISKEIKVYSGELRNLQTTIDNGKILSDGTKAFLHGLTFGLSKVVANAVDPEVSQPREKIFIALGTFKDYIQDSVDRGDMTIDEFNLKFAKIREDFIELFKNFSDTITWQILFLNSLVDNNSADEMVKEIFGALKELYG